jgi:hypothetical protein
MPAKTFSIWSSSCQWPLLSMMTCLTREERTGFRPPSRERCLRTLPQFTKADGPRQRYAPPSHKPMWNPACAGQVDAVELCLAGRMESNTVRLTYRGGVRGVSMLAQMLEEQGVSVRYAPPRETRDMTEAAAIVVVVLSATGNLHDIAAAVQMFRQKFGSNAQIEGLPEPKQSVEERLAAVDQLLADGTITPEEHAQQRTRILNEL